MQLVNKKIRNLFQDDSNQVKQWYGGKICSRVKGFLENSEVKDDSDRQQQCVSKLLDDVKENTLKLV